jgi:uncharacterized protein UPF0158
MSRERSKTGEIPKADAPLRKVPIAWEALEDAFENNAPEVHSYLHLSTGEVIRIVDGIADPGMHQRVMKDTEYLRVDPVSSREQYRWMERFIATVEESELRDQLVRAIDGKGAFRRFKDVLMSFPVDRERWFSFRSERLRSCMEAWLAAHGIEALERTEWRVPTAEEVRPAVEREEEKRAGRRSRAAVADAHRRRLHEVVDALPARELDAALAYLEFLRERKHLPRPQAKDVDEGVSGDGSEEAAMEPSGLEEDVNDDEGADEDEAEPVRRKRSEEQPSDG